MRRLRPPISSFGRAQTKARACNDVGSADGAASEAAHLFSPIAHDERGHESVRQLTPCDQYSSAVMM